VVVSSSKMPSDSVSSPNPSTGTAPGLIMKCPPCVNFGCELESRRPGVAPDSCSSLLRLRRLVSLMTGVEADAATIVPAEGCLSLSNFLRNSSTFVAFFAFGAATIALAEGCASPSNLLGNKLVFVSFDDQFRSRYSNALNMRGVAHTDHG
jgi:hypothetical protein